MTSKLSPRIALVIIAGLFVLPLALAWLMYSGAIDYQPAETRNLGALVEPPVPAAFASLEVRDPAGPTEGDWSEHWLVLYATPDPCGAACLADAEGLRQVHRAAGRNQSRIRLMLLGPGAQSRSDDLLSLYPAFFLASDPGGDVTATLDAVAAAQNAATPGSLYLVDPLGNIMMFYAAGFDPNDLKKDLKRLLTWSKLDEQ
jgi:hypothetical protein